jgi:hypothetical protein
MTDPIAAKNHACNAWYRFTHEHGLKTLTPDWRQSIAPDGAPRLTAQVVGPGAAADLHLFGSQQPLLLGRDGDIRPTYDYANNRVTVVWRHQGVWVELWVPDTQPATPSPVAVPQRPALPGVDAKRLIHRPSGRLPFGRRTKTPKETTT